MDFVTQLKTKIKEHFPSYPIVHNINQAQSDIAIVPLPGSRTIRSFMDGAKDKAYNYELQGKTKDPKDVEDFLIEVSEYMQELLDLPSADDSYKFIDIDISDEPYFLEADDQGNFFFSLGFIANLALRGVKR